MARQSGMIDISSSTIFRTVLIVIGFWFVYLVWDIIVMLLAAIILSSVTSPLAGRLERFRIPRALSVLLVYILLLGILFGLGSIIVNPVMEQAQQLLASPPEFVQRLEGLRSVLPDELVASAANSLQESLLEASHNISRFSSNVVEGTRSFFSGVLTVIFVFILGFYLAAERDSLKRFFRIVTPVAHVAYVEQAIDRVQHRFARWFIAQALLGLIIGVVVGIGLWIMGVPYALLLAVVAGLLEFIPVIGPILAAIPAVFVGLSQSLVMGGAVLLFYVVIQQLENHFLIPVIMQRAVGLHPLVTMLAFLLGARLFGIVGAILSVPVATALAIFLRDIFSQTDDSPVTAVGREQL